MRMNDEVIDNPELLNEDPYANWILKIKVDHVSEYDNLLNAASYKEEQE